MAQYSDFTGLASANDIIPATQIGAAIAGYNYAPTIAQLVAWVENLDPGKGSSFTFPRWDLVTIPAGTKLETDEFDLASLDTSGEEVTPAYIGITVPMSREVLHDSSIGVQASGVIELGAALRNRIDADLLGLATSCATTQGAVTDVFNRTKLNAATATARAIIQPKGGQMVAILSPSAANAFRNDIDVSGATMTPEQAKDFGFGSLPVVCVYGNVVILESPHIPANSTGFENVITIAGKGRSGLGMVVAERVGAEYDVIAQRKVVNVTVAARVGFGITAQRNLVSTLSA